MKSYTIFLIENENRIIEKDMQHSGLVKTNDGRWIEHIVFECQADSFAHAEEQALAKHPECFIFQIEID